jgi:hypothetical protein
MKDPDRLRATFARAFGPLVLTPCAEGYRVAGNIKAPEIRAGSGGLSPSNASCGGRGLLESGPASVHQGHRLVRASLAAEDDGGERWRYGVRFAHSRIAARSAE